jgi:ribosome biogenesis GTPase
LAFFVAYRPGVTPGQASPFLGHEHARGLFFMWRNPPVPSRQQKQWRHYEENKAMRKVRKQIKRNRKTKRTRRKDWRPDNMDLDSLDDLDIVQDERVMPRGERERRQTVLNEALTRIRKEQEEEEKAIHSSTNGDRQAMVVEVSSSMCRVDLDGQTILCGLRGSLSAEDTGYTNVVAVGDQVLISQNGSEQGIVEQVLPRTSVLSRPDPFYNHLRQAVVANAEQLLIIASWRDPAFWPALIDRYLIAAERSNLSPVLCVNKVDLADDMAACHAATEPYLQLGYPVLLTSALRQTGIEDLKERLAGRASILAGLSGVGKSSLLNAVQPGLQLRTAEISERLKMGRHTTTQVNLFELNLGGYVIDTPGIRDFGLAGLLRTDLIDYYPGIQDAARRCRFSDCSHTHEPGCGVQAAVQAGRIAEARYQSYVQIYETLPASHAQEQELAQTRAWR